MSLRISGPIAAAAALIVTACSPAAPSPTAAPPAPKPTAAAPAASPGASPGASPAAKPAASPVASPAASSPTSGPLPAAVSEEAARFFQGKTVTFTVGYAPGGGFDTFARILAVHMPRHIPGSPQIAVTNMPGGDSLVAAQNTIRKAPGNGLDIGIFTVGLIPRVLLGEKMEGFDPTAPIYLGMPDSAPSESQVCARTSVADSLDAFLKSPRKLKIGSTGTTGNVPVMMQWAAHVGLPIEPVTGYGGTSEANQAFERGEIDLTGFCDGVLASRFPHWFGPEQAATPLFYFSQRPKFLEPALAQGKYPWYKRVYDIINVTPAQRAALEAHLSFGGSRVFALPPRTPEPIVAALQHAFNATVNDPAARKDLEERGYEIGLLTGPDMQRVIAQFATQPPDVLEVLKAMYSVRG